MIGRWRAWLARRLVTDAMINRALAAAGRRSGDLGPVRMRAALEAALRLRAREADRD